MTAVDAPTATVHVGPRSAARATGLVAGEVNWLGEPANVGARLDVKIRSRSVPVPVTVTAAGADSFAVRAERQLGAVTPGQAAVLYDGGRVVGGGWIERGLPAA